MDGPQFAILMTKLRSRLVDGGLRLAIRKRAAISPKEVEKYLKISGKTVRKVLCQLVDKKMLIPASGIRRVRSYRLGDQVKNPI